MKLLLSLLFIGSLAEAKCKETKIVHWKLNHPSGLNRKNNDKEQIFQSLILCKDFINGVYD